MIAALVFAAHALTPLALDDERVYVARKDGIEVYARSDGELLARFPTGVEHVYRLYLHGHRLFATSGDRWYEWDDGRFVGSYTGTLRYVAADGTAWATAERSVTSDLPAGGRTRWSLPPRERDSALPTYPPQGPYALPLVLGDDNGDCELLAGGDRVACAERGDAVVRNALGEVIARVPGDLRAVGPAGFVTTATDGRRETHLYDNDARLLFTAPLLARGAGVGRDAFVLHDEPRDRLWVFPVHAPPSTIEFPDALEPGWPIALREPTVQVEGPLGSAWLAVDDLEILAAVPQNRGAAYVVAERPQGTRLTRPRASFLRKDAENRWLFDDAGRITWEIALEGVPGPLVETPVGRVQLFYGADGTLRAYDAANGRPRWTARLPGFDKRLPIRAAGDRVLVSDLPGWWLLDATDGRKVATGTGEIRDADALPAAFTDKQGTVFGRDGAVLTQVPDKARALGVLDDGGVVCAEGGAVVVRDGDRVRWWQALGGSQLWPARVVGDSVWLAGRSVVVRLDGRTGELTGAVPWPFGGVDRLRELRPASPPTTP